MPGAERLQSAWSDLVLDSSFTTLVAETIERLFEVDVGVTVSALFPIRTIVLAVLIVVVRARHVIPLR